MSVDSYAEMFPGVSREDIARIVREKKTEDAIVSAILELEEQQVRVACPRVQQCCKCHF